jgi:hypothetical protein
MANGLYQKIQPNQNISQGDIFFNFPIFMPDPKNKYNEIEKFTKEALEEKVKFKVYHSNIIILSQACDMVVDPSRNRKAIDPVVVAAIDSIDRFSWNLVSETNSGRKPAYYLLNKEDGVLGKSFIVDFTRIFTIQYEILSGFSKQYGERLRPSSPILEKMSQHFGNFFSRIGLEYERNSAELKAEHEKLKNDNETPHNT